MNLNIFAVCMHVCSQDSSMIGFFDRKVTRNLKNKSSLIQYDSHIFSNEMAAHNKSFNEIFLLEKAGYCVMAYMRLINLDDFHKNDEYFEKGLCFLYDPFNGKNQKNFILNEVKTLYFFL